MIPLLSTSFFELSFDCHPFSHKEELLTKKHLLPTLSSSKGPLGDVAIGWNREGILVNVIYQKDEFEICWPDFSSGDSIELFFDTRDYKETNYPTKFCHHFFFLPECPEKNDQMGGEISRFRGEERHNLSNDDLLKIKPIKRGKGRVISIFIPKECLCGYDSNSFTRMGFTYRINAPKGEYQIFSCDSQEVKIEQQPSLWASLELNV